MLGGFCARSGERVIDRFRTQKTGALLAYLAYHPERRHSREELGDLLWPDVQPEGMRQRLSQGLVSLRPLLESGDDEKGRILLADRATVGLSSDGITSDVAAFRAAMEAAETPPGKVAQVALEKALSLYTGALLPGYYEDWVLTERQCLLDLYLRGLRRLSSALEQAEEFERALLYTRLALEAEPFAEESHRDVIRLLAACGQKSAALRQAREMERILAEDTGEPPSATTRALVEQIRRSEIPAAAASSPASRLNNNLPVSLTRFFGRESEIAHMESLIRDGGTRLVTITGGGGGGKTRLAVETTGKLIEHFHGAVLFLPLVEMNGISIAQTALADLLSIPASASPLEEIIKAFGTRPFLLVLDNAEHLVTEVAHFVSGLLPRCPALTILVTSRQRLGLAGEREIPIPALSIPTGNTLTYLMDVDSVRLFVDRAQAIKPTFQVTDQNAAAIAALCARLEGIPLAIELCAAWSQTLTPQQMLQNLNLRFDLLVSRRADIPPRHRTLRAALEYSYLMLPADLQRFFVRLSVFRGGWILGAAEAVWEDLLTDRPPFAALTVLDELRERSLISSDENAPTDDEGGMRYRMLETLREFATEQRTMALEAIIGQRHAAYFLSRAEEAQTQETGPPHGAWLARLEADHDNFRAALAWFLEQRLPEQGLRLAVALTPFWEVRGYINEGLDWLRRFLANDLPRQDAPVSPMIRAKALNALAHLSSEYDFEAAAAAAGEALDFWRTANDPRGAAASLVILGIVADFQANDVQAQSYLEEGLRLAREAQDRPIIVSALLNLGGIAMNQEQWQDAWALTAESLALLRVQGRPKRIADALNNLGLIARYQKNFAEARKLLLENLGIRREASNPTGTAIALLNLATVNRLEGRLSEARSSISEATLLASDVGNRRVLAHCVKELGHLACAEQEYPTGLRLLALSETLRKALGMSFRPADPEEIDRDTILLQAKLGSAEVGVAWSAADDLSPEEAVMEAMRLAHLT